MEFLCYENQIEMSVLSAEDRVLIDDCRVLDNMLIAQNSNRIVESYFNKVQQEITSDMRRILTTWMAEVCDDQCCEEVVFPLATLLLDRVLSCLSLQKSQLQLLGSVCLLLASKLRQCRSLSGELICYYTDYSITMEELISWEMLVLSKLGWSISSMTATDFLTPLISRIKFNDHQDIATKIRQHAQIFISLCSTEFQFSLYESSLVAVSSLCVAASGLSVDKEFLNQMMTTFEQLTGHGIEHITKCVMEIEKLFSSQLTSVHQNMYMSNQKRTTSGGNNHCGSKSTSGVQQEDLSQPETPTDLQDIHF